MKTAERVIQMLAYQDIQAAHDFLVQPFGFKPGGVVRVEGAREAPNGRRMASREP